MKTLAAMLLGAEDDVGDAATEDDVKGDDGTEDGSGMMGTRQPYFHAALSYSQTQPLGWPTCLPRNVCMFHSHRR
jgi:hypothetical protein